MKIKVCKGFDESNQPIMVEEDAHACLSSAVAAHLITKLSTADIQAGDKEYPYPGGWGDSLNIEFILNQLLIVSCYLYIKGAKLDRKSTEYQNIVRSIGLLTSRFRQDGKPLPDEEIETLLFTENVIPIDLNSPLAEPDDDNPYYVYTKRFLQVISLTFNIMITWEPMIIDDISPDNLDGEENLLKSAIKAIQQRQIGIQFMKNRNKNTVQKISKPPVQKDSGRIDFDL